MVTAEIEKKCGNCDGPPDNAPLDGPKCLEMNPDDPGCEWWNPRAEDEKKEPQDPPKEFRDPAAFWNSYNDHELSVAFGEPMTPGRFVLRAYRCGSRQDRAIWDRKHGKWRARGLDEVRSFLLGWAYGSREASSLLKATKTHRIKDFESIPGEILAKFNEPITVSLVDFGRAPMATDPLGGHLVEIRTKSTTGDPLRLILDRDLAAWLARDIREAAEEAARRDGFPIESLYDQAEKEEP